MSERSRLVRMRISNFGCFGGDGLVVSLDDIVCLVGPNNTGKSTVLRAYEAAVRNQPIVSDEMHLGAGGKPTSVELWVHIPEGAENIDAKWKEKEGKDLLVRSKWEWATPGTKPVRTTWNPQLGEYSTDAKASGLDEVFTSRLPQPLRIESLQDPQEEHRQLLALVIDPVVQRIRSLMQEEGSALRKSILDLQAEAEKPVAAFQKEIDEVEQRVNSAYRHVFTGSEVKVKVSLGQLAVDPERNLLSASRVEIVEPHGQTGWTQQGTGSKRALFWSMLQVRSELARIEGERRQREKRRLEIPKEIERARKDALQATKPETKAKREAIVTELQAELESLSQSGAGPAAAMTTASPFLPGHMLLIDEPETALHPSAVRAAKEHLYSLADEVGWQVMLSTHHPAFVDPLKDHTTIVRLDRPGPSAAPNVYRSRDVLFEGDEKEVLKQLLAFDMGVAEMFFGPRVVIVEGDTEFAAFSEVMHADPGTFPIDMRPLMVRARGKAAIPILIKVLSHFSVDFAVLHDIDSPRIADGTKKNSAYTVNSSIQAAVATARTAGRKIVHRCSCPTFEVQHGMDMPEKDKPFESWKIVRSNPTIAASIREVLNVLITQPPDGASEDPLDGRHCERQLREWVSANAAGDSRYVFD